MPRKIAVEIVGDSSSLERAFRRSARSATTFNRSVDRASKVGGSAFGNLARSVTLASGAFLGATGFVAITAKAVDAASSLNEELSRSGVVFQGSADDVQQWSTTTAAAFGISQRAALEAASNFGTMFRTIGLGGDVAAGMSKRLVELAADMASFSNQTPEDMLDRLRSGLAGEAEPLRRFGVLLSEARVQQEAYASGIAATGAKLTEQQKVQARYLLILKDTAIQQGDFGRTSANLANQLRILRATVDVLFTKLGQALLPIITDVVTKLNVWLADTRNQERVQKDFIAVLNFVIDTIKLVRNAIRSISQAWTDLQNFWRRKQLEFRRDSTKIALAIIEPLSHIPRKLGGGIFQDAKAELLAGMRDINVSLRQVGQEGGDAYAKGVSDAIAEKVFALRATVQQAAAAGTAAGTAAAGGGGAGGATVEQRNAWWDAAIGRQRDRVQDIQSLQGQLDELRRIAALIEQRIAITKDVTRRLRLEDELLDVQRQQRGVLEAIRDRTAQLKAERQALEEQAAERRRLARNARQFVELGLTRTGEERVPGIRALRRQLASIRELISGVDVPQKVRDQLTRVGRVLSESIVGRDVRQKVREMLDAIDDEFRRRRGDVVRFRQLNAQRFLAMLGLDLTLAQARRLKAALSTLGPNLTVPQQSLAFAGAGAIQVGTVNVYGVQDVAKFETELTKRASRRASVRRGAR